MKEKRTMDSAGKKRTYREAVRSSWVTEDSKRMFNAIVCECELVPHGQGTALRHFKRRVADRTGIPTSAVEQVASSCSVVITANKRRKVLTLGQFELLWPCKEIGEIFRTQ